MIYIDKDTLNDIFNIIGIMINKEYRNVIDAPIGSCRGVLCLLMENG